MNIRAARAGDFAHLYEIGLNTPELRVGAMESFMDEDEFRGCINDKDGVFLVAEEEGELAGFVLANAKDKDKPFLQKYACLVYLVVLPAWRRKGVARMLYEECERQLKKLGITCVYSWASLDGGIQSFLGKQGFVKGKPFVWMEKKV